VSDQNKAHAQGQREKRE